MNKENEQLDIYHTSENVDTKVDLHRIPKAQAPSARRFEEEVYDRKRAEQVTKTLFKISNAVSTTKDLPELYSSIHQILGEVIDLTNFYIAIYCKDKDLVSFPYFVDDYDSGDVYSDQVKEENSLTGSVLRNAVPVFCTKKDLEKRRDEKKIVGTIPLVWIGVPLIIGGEVIGVMSTQSYHNPDLFDEMDKNTLVSVSDQVALAIERKQNEQTIIASEKKYRTILETIQDGYFEMDFSGNFTLANLASCKIMGETINTLIGANSFEFFSDQAVKDIQKAMDTISTSQQTGSMLEIEIVRKDGTQRYVETSLSATYDSAGNHIGFKGIARDITQRKHTDKAQKILGEQLQQAQRLESLGTLAGGIAHDFNNLLMGIQGRIALLQNDFEAIDQDTSQLVSIENYVERAASLTSRLLGFARGGKYELKPTDANLLIKNSIKLFGRTKKEITFITDFEEQPHSIEVDSNQIEEVLLNLFVNAWQATDLGGDITINTSIVDLDETLASFHTIQPGTYIEITIADTGKGIAEENISKIFDPFFTTKSLGGGTGLGLAMVYGIIKNHSGAISVESKINEGTCFSLLLPASLKTVPTEQKPKIETKKGHETILLVDDEQMITEVGKDMLEVLGYDVFTASSGEEAVNLYSEKQEQIDLLIIDMIMPKMSGGELFDKLKTIDPLVRVLLSSGYSVEGEAQKILDRGCKGFIQKPFSMSLLSEKLREIVL